MSWTGVLSFAVVTLVVASASAQGVPPTTDVATEPTDVPTPEPSSTWTLTGRFLQAYDSNPIFMTGGIDGPAENLGASIRRTTLGPKGQLDFSAGGGLQVYPSSPELNGLTWDVAGTGTRRLSNRLALNAGLTFQSGIGQQSRFLVENGLLVGGNRANTTQATAGLVYRLSERTSLSSAAGYDRVGFSPAEDTATRVLRGGFTGSVTTTLQRALAENQVAVEHSYSRSTSDRLLSQRQAFRVRWARRLSARTRVMVAGGPIRVTYSVGSSWQADFLGSLFARLGRGTGTAAVARSVSQAYGYGRERLADSARASYSVPLGRRLTLSTSANYTRSRTLADQGVPSVDVLDEIASGSTTFAMSLARRTSLEGSYAVDHRFSTGLRPAATRHYFSVSLSQWHTWE